jgi:hypothetical protein
MTLHAQVEALDYVGGKRTRSFATLRMTKGAQDDTGMQVTRGLEATRGRRMILYDKGLWMTLGALAFMAQIMQKLYAHPIRRIHERTKFSA